MRKTNNRFNKRKSGVNKVSKRSGGGRLKVPANSVTTDARVAVTTDSGLVITTG